MAQPNGKPPNLPTVLITECSASAVTDAVTARTSGKLNYLVNNSGHGLVLPIRDADLDQTKLFDVNSWGIVAVTHAFMPLVIAAKGTIVNSASLAAVLYVPWVVRSSLFSILKIPLSSLDSEFGN